MYTKHAKIRMKQRGLEPLVVDLLLSYGAEQHDKRGGTRRYFDKLSRRRVQRAIGRRVFKRLEDLLDAYLIEQDGHIITVGWRH